MNLDRAIREKQYSRERINELFSSAIRQSYTARHITRRYIFILKHNVHPDTPQWVRHYLHGMHDARIDELYRTHLHYVYQVKGTLYSIHRDREDYYRKHGIAPSDLTGNPSGHHWKKNNRPFYTSIEETK